MHVPRLVAFGNHVAAGVHVTKIAATWASAVRSSDDNFVKASSFDATAGPEPKAISLETTVGTDIAVHPHLRYEKNARTTDGQGHEPEKPSKRDDLT